MQEQRFLRVVAALSRSPQYGPIHVLKLLDETFFRSMETRLQLHDKDERDVITKVATEFYYSLRLPNYRWFRLSIHL